MYLYSIAEWMEIDEEELEIFDFDAELTSPWVKICPKIRKNKEEQCYIYFPCMKMDEKGNICLKFGFLHEIILAKLYIVLDQIRVVLINSNSKMALTTLLEMVSAPEK